MKHSGWQALLFQPTGFNEQHDVNYDQIFDQAIDRLHEEGRYRVFIDIMRNKGAYPNARCFHGHNGPKPITVWCSNDYLAMGQHDVVI